MVLDLLLIAGHPLALRSACRRGWWGPVALPGAESRCLTHLAVLPPQATAIEQLAPIRRIAPWPRREDKPPAANASAGDHPRWRLTLAPLRTLRRPIPLDHKPQGGSPLLDAWWPRNPGERRLLSIDGLLLSDSLADSLRRLQPSPIQPAQRLAHQQVAAGTRAAVPRH